MAPSERPMTCFVFPASAASDAARRYAAASTVSGRVALVPLQAVAVHQRACMASRLSASASEATTRAPPLATNTSPPDRSNHGKIALRSLARAGGSEALVLAGCVP